MAGAVLSEAEAILRIRPRLGTLVEQARELRQRVAATSTPSGAWALSLTAAELRLLPLLTTHLAFPQIGGRLFLSRTTIKTQAISIYRRFGGTSRAEAIERAVQLGLRKRRCPPRAAAEPPAPARDAPRGRDRSRPQRCAPHPRARGTPCRTAAVRPRAGSIDRRHKPASTVPAG